MPEPQPQLEKAEKIEAERQAILKAREKGLLAKLTTYTRLSGPGWLQSALTLGGGSLASSLYLGVLAGFGLLWLQPMAMILGIIMLSAIGYVAMSTTERPFRAINRHVNPVLGWGWALASLLANMVWCLPQYSLASGVLQQNLLPKQLGAGSQLGTTVGTFIQNHLPGLLPAGADVGDFGGKVIISAAILLITVIVTWTYDSGGRGIKLYELLLKFVVAGIVACFVGVLVVLSMRGTLNWGEIFSGFIPDLTKLWQPAVTYDWLLSAVPESSRAFWADYIVREQRDVMISAAATAVGINMTFLLPYSMLRRGWDKEFRGLATFDLSTGMFIPFVLATSCVVVASATQFHPLAAEFRMPAEIAGEATGGEKVAFESGTIAEVLVQKDDTVEAGEPLFRLQTDEGTIDVTHPHGGKIIAVAAQQGDEVRSGQPLLSLHEAKADPSKLPAAKLKAMQVAKLQEQLGPEEFQKLKQQGDAAIQTQLEPLTDAELLLFAHLQRKDATALSKSLTPLTGRVVADLIFGIGVVGMTLSSITLLMLISGFVICELLGLPPKGWPNRLGCLAATTGVLGPFLWSGEARFWLAVPTSVFCFTLLPFAYVTFFLMMNSKGLLGDQMPRGVKRLAWNFGMGIAAGVATLAAVYMVWVKCEQAAREQWHWSYGGYVGLGIVAAVVLLVVFVHFVFPRKANRS